MRRYVEQQLLDISRRYVKKFGNPAPGDTIVGYKSFSEVCRDLDGVVNVLWLSSTRRYLSCSVILIFIDFFIAMLQIPFLLKLASDFTQYVRSFPPSPKATFALLRKLDHCFASLLTGKDIDSNEPLPGFENGLRAGMTTTDMVRCRSLVEQTRVLMVEVLSQGVEEVDDEDDEGGDETDTNMDDVDDNGPSAWDVDDEEEERMHLDSARVYENTIIHLNERLGDSLTTRMERSDD